MLYCCRKVLKVCASLAAVGVSSGSGVSGLRLDRGWFSSCSDQNKPPNYRCQPWRYEFMSTYERRDLCKRCAKGKRHDFGGGIGFTCSECNGWSLNRGCDECKKVLCPDCWEAHYEHHKARYTRITASAGGGARSPARHTAPAAAAPTRPREPSAAEDMDRMRTKTIHAPRPRPRAAGVNIYFTIALVDLDEPLQLRVGPYASVKDLKLLMQRKVKTLEEINNNLHTLSPIEREWRKHYLYEVSRGNFNVKVNGKEFDPGFMRRVSASINGGNVEGTSVRMIGIVEGATVGIAVTALTVKATYCGRGRKFGSDFPLELPLGKWEFNPTVRRLRELTLKSSPKQDFPELYRPGVTLGLFYREEELEDDDADLRDLGIGGGAEVTYKAVSDDILSVTFKNELGITNRNGKLEAMEDQKKFKEGKWNETLWHKSGGDKFLGRTISHINGKSFKSEGFPKFVDGEVYEFRFWKIKLPFGWSQKYDKNSGRFYYQDEINPNGKNQWEKPLVPAGVDWGFSPSGGVF